MYKDIISYKLAEGITEERLLKVASQIIKDWMSKLDGFIDWEITKNDAGEYTDIVHWTTKEAAKKAELEMGNIPNAMDWYSCYEQGSISSKNLTKIN